MKNLRRYAMNTLFCFPPFAGILRDAKCHRELRLSSLDRYHTRVSSTRHIWLNVHIAGDLGYYSWRGRFSNYILGPPPGSLNNTFVLVSPLCDVMTELGGVRRKTIAQGFDRDWSEASDLTLATVR